VYVRKELIEQLEPTITGWMAFEGTDDFSRLTEYNPTFRSDARRFGDDHAAVSGLRRHDDVTGAAVESAFATSLKSRARCTSRL